MAHTALVAAAICYWDAYLLKKYMEDPLPVFALLVTGFALVCVLRWLALRIRPDARRGLARIWAGIDRGSLLILAFAFALAGVQHYAYMRAASDGRAYFLMVRSLLIDWDVQFEQDVAHFGYYGGVMSYALGTPLLWIPFYLAGHVWLLVCNLGGAEYPLDGYFNPYQRAVGFGTLVYGTAALFVLRALLRRHFGEGIAVFSTLAIALGGWLAWYMSVDASWSHAASALSCALFVDYWDRTRVDRTTRQWLVFGLLGGLMVLVRWQNVFFAVFPAYDALRDYAGEPHAWKPTLRSHAIATAGAALVFLPQLVVWRFGRGSWFDLPAGDHPIFWDARYLWDTLFHLDRGIFTWTPLMAIATAGVFLFLRKDRVFAGLLLVAFALQIWINGTLWWGDHGFGARRFSQSIVIFAVGLAAFLAWARSRPMVVPAGVVVVLTVANLFFMREIHTTSLQQEGNVSFPRQMASISDRIGHPMALPVNAWFAWRYGGDWGLYGRLGSQTFNNLRIDLGTVEDHRFLGGGWSVRERAGGRTFRWSVGRTAFVVFMTKEKAPYELVIEAAPFLYPNATTQTIEVVLNGSPAGRIVLEKELRQYRLPLDEQVMASGLNAAEFRFATAVSPASQGLSADPRPLAVRFESIEFLRTN